VIKEITEKPVEKNLKREKNEKRKIKSKNKKIVFFTESAGSHLASIRD